MQRIKFEIFVFCWFLQLASVFGHGYIFSKANEEMKDNVRIEINRNFLLIRFESEYLGQIAPHIRLLIDSDSDNVLSSEEITRFFEIYKKTANESLQTHFLQVDGQSIPMRVVAIFAPTLTVDSLLAPFYVEIFLSAGQFDLATGEREIVIDPAVLFEVGNHFLRLAKDEVEFTLEQEKAIRRYLQIQVSGEPDIFFISTFPGRIRQRDNTAQIYGVFYEKSPTSRENLVYPAIRIKIRVS